MPRGTTERKLVALADYLDHCELTNVQPRYHRYKGMAPGNNWPSASNLGETKTWGEWLKAVDEWRREQRKKAA